MKVRFALAEHTVYPNGQVIEIWNDETGEMIGAIYQSESGPPYKGKIRIMSKHGIGLRVIESNVDMEVMIG